ncbi:DUF6123 family protein [Paraliobacillus sediminis]|uniref:DUF6123 family protein n=1 Tax=Paraliobacillus sediminis TaxID=1885916 RepID=UPI000E3C6E6A|nr:DUF6123 family protein [Paraliobacillus sediminis]
MRNNVTLGDYIEILWEKGFKLTDEEVQFIYFGKQYTNANDWLIIMAIKTTLQIQRQFDGSFYISLLELLQEKKVTTEKQAKKEFQKKGIM